MWLLSAVKSHVSCDLLIKVILKIISGIPEGHFPCLNTAPEFLSNVTELQFCNGNADCSDATDEPPYCPEGNMHICKFTLFLL